MAARVTVVNDNPDFLDLVREILDGDRYDTTTIDGDQPEALERIRASRPDVLMIDLRMGMDGLHGWDIAEQVRADSDLARVPILVCSADIVALRELAADLTEAHEVATLEKPFTIDHLVESIEGLLVGAARR
jgi:CheY-like chemotaxis protein